MTRRIFLQRSGVRQKSNRYCSAPRELPSRLWCGERCKQPSAAAPDALCWRILANAAVPIILMDALHTSDLLPQLRIYFGTILSPPLMWQWNVLTIYHRRINNRSEKDENMVWTDSQDYGADEILYTVRTVLFDKPNRLMREIAILFGVSPRLFQPQIADCNIFAIPDEKRNPLPAHFLKPPLRIIHKVGLPDNRMDYPMRRALMMVGNVERMHRWWLAQRPCTHFS